MGVKAHVVRTNLAFTQDKPPTKIKKNPKEKDENETFLKRMNIE